MANVLGVIELETQWKDGQTLLYLNTSCEKTDLENPYKHSVKSEGSQ